VSDAEITGASTTALWMAGVDPWCGFADAFGAEWVSGLSVWD
jgi:hypothetical protein